jgi:hypothetical protein
MSPEGTFQREKCNSSEAVGSMDGRRSGVMSLSVDHEYRPGWSGH